MRERLIAGLANGVGAGALWGLVFLAPLLLHDFSPVQLAASRYLGYGVVAAAVLLPRWRHVRGLLHAREWGALVWLSLLGNIIYYVLLGAAVQWAGSAATALIIGLIPVVVTLYGARGAGAVSLSRLLAPCALCVAGVVLVALASLHGGSGPQQPLATRAAGLACAFGALLSWSAYSIGNAHWLSRRPDLSGGDWSLLTGVVTGALALLLVPAAFAFDAATHAPADWLRFWGVASALAVLASVVGNACWNRASRLLPLTLIGQMIVFETVFALLYGFAWEWRLPSALEAVAIACLLGGVLWCASAHVERRRPAAA